MTRAFQRSPFGLDLPALFAEIFGEMILGGQGFFVLTNR
jgi:hypothetical protein